MTTETLELPVKQPTCFDGSPMVPCSTCHDLTSQSHSETFYGLCGGCYAKLREKENLADTEKKDRTAKGSLQFRMERWDEICPELYRKTDISFIQPDKFKKITSWKHGQMGLMVSGHSRAGKTTSVWHLLHKIYVLEGKTFKSISEPEFSIEREKNSRQGTLDSFLSACIRCDVFFLDDLGHAATSSRNLEELYHIIEKRTSWKRPVICTTNFTREELEEKGNKSGSIKTAVAILNRISSFCYHVHF